MSEHYYIRALIIDRFETEYKAIASTYQPLIDQARLQRDDLEIELLKSKREFFLEQILIERIRAEEIVYWLEQDTQLRKLGTSYAESWDYAFESAA